MIIDQKFVSEIEDLYGKHSAELVEKAFSFADEKLKGLMRDNGDEYVSHCLNSAKILFSMKADVASIICALVHSCLNQGRCSEKEIEQNFGSTILKLSQGVGKIALIKRARMQNLDQNDELRKMILTLENDARVAFVKLADRLDNIQTLDCKPRDKQVKIAQETLDLFTPICERLGMYRFKHSMEDLCFKYLYPQEYDEVTKYLQEYYKKCEKINQDISQKLHELVKSFGLDAIIQSRIKSAYGVFKKQSLKGKDSVYDVIAHRIIVDEIKDCYTMLGAVHDIWKPVENRIKDYITNPKKNLYQSLHTTVLYPTENGGIPFEIQIRTKQMHIFCEYGMAAHWMYKENRQGAGNSAMLELKSKVAFSTNESEEIQNLIKTGFYQGEIFVFTPQLKVIELPEGANTIDFAYAVHSNLGNKCVGAKINDKMVPLGTVLHTGDIVEILTSSMSKGPSRDWLKICKSRGAIGKIRNYFKKEKRDENIKIGKDILEEHLKRKGYSLSKFVDEKECLEEVLFKYSIQNVLDLFAAVGYGGLTTAQVTSKFIAKEKKQGKQTAKANIRPTANKTFDEIYVEGQGDMLKRVAKCCNPIPGDDIVGYVSRGRGVTIHRSDCPCVAQLEKERIVQTNWSGNLEKEYVANFKVFARGSLNILSVVSNKISDNKIEISYINSEKTKDGDIILTVGVLAKSRTQLDELLNKIESIPDVLEVKR